MITTFEDLMEIHASDALGRLLSVVVVIDINHKAA